MTFAGLVNRSALLRKAYKRVIAPRLRQPESDIFILRTLQFSVSIDVGANIGLYTLEKEKKS